jgi:exo-beta-1,3-glucanase (GH17 family)
VSGSVGAIRIINTFGGQTVNDVGTLHPFNNVTISDPNVGQTETVTVTLSAAANGVLSNLGGGIYNAATGVYIDIGTADAITTALDGLVFTPTWHQVAPGATVTTTFTVVDSDAVGATATDSATTITATGTNNPLPIGPIYGIDYGPSPTSGGPYPSAAQINTDMSYIAEMANTVRLYTVSNGMSYAVTSAIAHGLHVVPSAYLVDPSTPAGAAANTAEIANLISVLNDPATDLTKIPFVDVGSDFLASNPTRLSYLISEIQYVKAHIPSGVMVTTSESIGNYASNPSLASAVDSIFPTISPYTLGGIVDVNNASQLALIQYQNLVAAFPTRNVVISEIGWPSSGTTGSVVGSVANEEAFWTQFILTAAQNHINYFGFQAFDSPTNTNTGFSGPNWGLYTSSDTAKGAVISLRPVPPPLIVGTVAGQLTNDLIPVSPFSGVAISDPNAGQTETVTVTLSAAANGTLSNLGTGSYNAGTGVYTVTGTATGVTSALDSLIFVPTQHMMALGQTFVTTFTIADTDTAGVTATDGTTTVTTTPIVIESAGATKLIYFGNQYSMLPMAGGTGTVLTYNGTAVTIGEFGTTVNPIGAEATATGFEVAWKVSGTSSATDQYIVWYTDAIGNYLSSPTGVVPRADPAMENIEVSFHQDLNGDGTVGLAPTAIESSSVTPLDTGVTTLGQVGNQFAMLPTGGNTGTVLKYNGASVTIGEFGTTVNPIGAEATATGFEVAWKVSGVTDGTDQYIIWNTDSSGNYLSSPTGVVTGQSFALEDLEPSFQQDLNGDGRLSTQLNTTAVTNVLNLSGQSQATTINLGSNTASASVGLSQPSLTFIHIPYAITLGTGASIVEYALQPSSGIETVVNFVFGTDELNIDLAGAANGTLLAFDTFVGGNHAIALASNGDLAHGIVLLNVSGGLTAANLLASHTSFTGGHALIT